jgi:hypothetical protein
MRLTFEAMGRFFAWRPGMASSFTLNILPARFNFIMTDVNSLKLTGFIKFNSSHAMQAVVE